MSKTVEIEVDDSNTVMVEERGDGLRLIVDSAVGTSGVTLDEVSAAEVRDALDGWLKRRGSPG